MKIALLNTTICTGGAGSYQLESITLGQARGLISEGIQFDSGLCISSHIGHESTASIMSTLLEIPVKMDRTPFTHDDKTVALCFKLNGRPPEGTILDAEEINAIGYEWYTMRFTPKSQQDAANKPSGENHSLQFNKSNEQLKTNFQSAINHLGKEFTNVSALDDPNTGTTLVWSGFGYEYAGWYLVNMHERGGHDGSAIIASAVFSVSELDLSKA